ncbi:protoglobin domain-containing protein [Domibacillus epiphyticus]|uniref:Globin-sensor domain-containing protein n=1 Tax=Domibacillus epiphyticus TaxID=1714355 RepID=A0A1V2A3W1_9BACI|nr:protoglobin domain-containing protein [Domibacillus epiphyticus]OMP65693.1 hypothetical protein BTO28_16190 [Domibacillus epiphyticus]
MISYQPDIARLTHDDLVLLQKVHPVVVQHVDGMIESFTGNLTKTDKFLNDAHLSQKEFKRILKTHIPRLFEGVLDEDFLAEWRKTALLLIEMGIDIKEYFFALHHLLDSIMTIVEETSHSRQSSIIRVASKMIHLEQQIVLAASERAVETDDLTILIGEAAASLQYVSRESASILQTAEESKLFADQSVEKSLVGRNLLMNQVERWSELQEMIDELKIMTAGTEFFSLIEQLSQFALEGLETMPICAEKINCLFELVTKTKFRNEQLEDILKQVFDVISAAESTSNELARSLSKNLHYTE